MTSTIIAVTILSQLDSEVIQYQVFTELDDHKRNVSTITKVDGLIKSSNGDLHRKKTTHGWNS